MTAAKPSIRVATPADAADVAQLSNAFQREFDDVTPGAEVLEERLARMIELDETTIVLIGDGPDGFAELRFRKSKLTGALDAYLEELYVVPKLRGQGLGRVLLEAAIETARERGATYIELGTGEDDTAARALYESAGFDNRGGRPDGAVNYFYERQL